MNVSCPKVVFYTKAGCHLCDDARALLDEIATQIPFELTEIDIRSTRELFDEYRYQIPVIIIDETTIVAGRIEYEELARAFRLPL